jgi:hypothetical protein
LFPRVRRTLRYVEHLDIDLEPLLARLVEERLEALTGPAGAA